MYISKLQHIATMTDYFIQTEILNDAGKSKYKGGLEPAGTIIVKVVIVF